MKRHKCKAEVPERWKGTNVALLRSKKSHSNTGVKGVSRIEKEGLYAVNIETQGRKTYVGRFANLDDAIKARKAAEDEQHEPLIKQYEEETNGIRQKSGRNGGKEKVH